MERTCEHWEMAFCVIDTTIYIECMKCKVKASLQVDGNYIFTTTRAKMALEQAKESHVS